MIPIDFPLTTLKFCHWVFKHFPMFTSKIKAITASEFAAYHRSVTFDDGRLPGCYRMRLAAHPAAKPATTRASGISAIRQSPEIDLGSASGTTESKANDDGMT